MHEETPQASCGVFYLTHTALKGTQGGADGLSVYGTSSTELV